MSILILNAGSSTLKFSLFDAEATYEICGGSIGWRGGGDDAILKFRISDSRAENNNGKASKPTLPQQKSATLADYGEAVDWILRTLVDHGFEDSIDVVGHRVVHGGNEFRDTILIDDHVSQALRTISKLAPLHHPPVLATLEAALKSIPGTPQVAVFDTSFFVDLPEQQSVYPVPFEWREKYGIRRFGFHGISHEYCATRAAELLDRQSDPELRLVICHLGNGSSAAATCGGRPMATTFGFTPLEGLMMGTRSGSIDPGILIFLMQEFGFDAAQLQASLNKQSGLLGVSGVSSDFRDVEQAAVAGNDRAKLAIEMFADRVRATIGALAVTLGGVDALIFTAGIGEHSATLRSRVCEGLGCLGIALDKEANKLQCADSDIAAPESTSRILLLRTREERMMANEVRQLLMQSRVTLLKE